MATYMKEELPQVNPIMSERPFAPIKHALKEASGHLGYVVSHGRLIAQYDAWLQAWLTTPLKGNCRVANFSDSTLVIMVTKSELATRVICQQQEILQFFKSTHHVAFPSLKVIIPR
jgi:hypothetical protein